MPAERLGATVAAGTFCGRRVGRVLLVLVAVVSQVAKSQSIPPRLGSVEPLVQGVSLLAVLVGLDARDNQSGQSPGCLIGQALRVGLDRHDVSSGREKQQGYYQYIRQKSQYLRQYTR